MDWNTFWTAGATIVLILGGVAGLLKWILIGINEKFSAINTGLEKIETNIQALDKRLTIVETILGMMTNGYCNHKEK